jgi:hypothetical protein
LSITRTAPALESFGNVLVRNWRNQRIEFATGTQKQPLGRMLGPAQSFQFARNQARHLPRKRPRCIARCIGMEWSQPCEFIRNHTTRSLRGYFAVTHPRLTK